MKYIEAKCVSVCAYNNIMSHAKTGIVKIKDNAALIPLLPWDFRSEIFQK